MSELWEPYREAIVAYWKWLDGESPAVCKRFLARVASSDQSLVEGAIGEAVAWNWLEPRCSKINLNETEDAGGVDFKCESASETFYVEATVLTTEKVTERTGLDHVPANDGAKFYRTDTGAIKREVIAKASQARGLGHPFLLFIATLHFEMTAIGLDTRHLEELLIGATVIQSSINRETGEPIGPIRQVASFDHSVFFTAGTSIPRRCHIAGVLLGGFGVQPPDSVVRGVLHPQPLRPFNVRCLPDVCFGRIEPWPLDAQSRVAWRRADGTHCDSEFERQLAREQAERRLRAEGLGALLDEVRNEIRWNSSGS